MENKTIKGYKVFKPDFTAKENNFQYAENTEYKHNGPIKICASGFHFFIKAQHCFSYYDFNPENIVCEVEALGKTDMHEQDSKVCTDHIRIGRRLTWAEVLVVANDGANNTGHSNSGNWNSGDRNSGNWNSGDRNSGDSNSGYRNSGAFCIDKNPFLILFDKPTTIRVREWENHPVHDVMRKLDPTLWIPAYLMSDEEKAANPKYETADGYLKTISMKDAWKNLWPNLSDDKKKLFTSLPNFDAAKFKEITGIDA